MLDNQSREPVISGTAKYTLFMLTIVYALNFIDRQILVILQEPIKLEMGLSDTQLGLMTGLTFALIYITAGIPIAYWADRGNRRNIVAIAVVVWSGMTAMSGLAQSYAQLLLARIGVGLGEAGGSPPSHSMISDYYPPGRRATALGIYALGVPIGIFLGYMVGGLVLKYFGWRVAFMLAGIPGVLFGLLFFLTVKEPRRGRWESDKQAEFRPTLLQTVALLRGCPTFWLAALAMGVAGFVGFGSANFTPSFMIRSHGLSPGDVGVMLALVLGLGGGVSTFLGGYIADQLGARDKRWYLWVPGFAGLLAIPLGLPYLLVDSVGLVLVFLALGTVLGTTYLGPTIGIAHALVPPAMRALVSAVLFFVVSLIGMGFGPLAVGMLSDFFTERYGAEGLRYAVICVQSLGVLSAILYLLAARQLLKDLAKVAAADDELV